MDQDKNMLKIETNYTIKGNNMPMYEATVRTPNGEEKKRVYADTPQEAKRLLEQLHGGPRAVPYIPHIVAS